MILHHEYGRHTGSIEQDTIDQMGAVAAGLAGKRLSYLGVSEVAMRIKAALLALVVLALVVCAPTFSLGQAAEDDRRAEEDRRREDVFWRLDEMDRNIAALTPLPLDGLQAVCAVRARWFGELEELLGEVRISETTILVARYYLDMVNLCWPTTSDVETCTALAKQFRASRGGLSGILEATTYAKAGLDLKCWGG